jgi:hypothetical protein
MDQAPSKQLWRSRLFEAIDSRHSLGIEALAIVAIYLVYEGGRGLTGGGLEAAVEHAHSIASLERSLHLFVERDVQEAARALPGVLGIFGVLYLTLHLGATGGYLLWLHQRRPAHYALRRTTLVVATLLSSIVFVVYPTAPPRLAQLGIVDTVSTGHVDLNHGLVHSFYNPFAAMPSMHFGYALIVGLGLLRLARTSAVRAAALAYPVLVLLIIVATGNHFVLDAAGGALVAGIAFAAARSITPSARHVEARESSVRSSAVTVATAGRHDGSRTAGVNTSRCPRRSRAASTVHALDGTDSPGGSAP